ncbi:CehA/McbA family metallohydrolase [uncultured Gimesia sp.]|uniref:CehA/McbA family metallohydrolase n=1 Tax=uncultured Gimesia sp. TaxID=1678688 RepID=UPI00263513AC|nr:CehA/McbA family metallohydrolase [uncultured Gimesia sp.]
MDVRYIRNFILLGVCGIAVFTETIEAAGKSISIDRDSHQIQGKQTFKKTFTAKANPTEFALLFEQNMKKQSSGGYWNVKLNEKNLGRLEAHLTQTGEDKTHDGFHRIGMTIPPNVLKEGENILTVTGRGQPAVLRNIQLEPRTLKQALQLKTVAVKVNTAAGQPMPARITVVNELGQLVKLYDVRTAMNAVRPGILYTLGVGDTFALPPGKYTLYATRGMEWGVGKQSIVVDGRQSQSHTLVISREVDTKGFLACDSHIHTLPGSGHGNATYEERMITIAGEGIEIAIATDHNHISDYSKYQRASGTNAHFHSISGDEVTTHNGHFTAFPLDPSQAVPGGVKGRNPLFLKSEDWTKLIADMRKKGAEVVILNHPYWPTIAKGPFGRFRFTRSTGGRVEGPEFSFNGLEVAQPANETPDFFYALEDWMSLLNRGLRLTAVGATDSHTVNDPVGQARTYLKGRTDNVADIDSKDVYRAFLEGRAVASSGIFANLSIAEQYGMGDLVPAAAVTDGTMIKVRLRVAAPSWIRPRDAMIYVNGKRVAQKTIKSKIDQPTDQRLEFKIEVPAHDAHVVAFVLGDGITLPGWTTYGKATQAITNPIYLDVDGDKKYRSPRETARRLIAKYREPGVKLTSNQQKKLLDTEAVKADSAVLLHVKDLLKEDSQ